MNLVQTIILSAGCAALAYAAYDADPGATVLLPADSASVFKLSANAGDLAKMSTQAVKGQLFSNALRIEVTKKPQRPTDVQISAPVDGAVKSGDILLVSFWMRSGAPGEATLDAGFRTAPGAAPAPGAGGGPGGFGARGTAGARGAAGASGAASAAGRGRGFGGFGGQPTLNAPALAGTAWKKVQFPFAASRDCNKGDAEVSFTFGMREQTVEIAGIELENYGTAKKVAELPYTKLGYQGEEPNAAWRKAAQARIEQVRKGDLTGEGCRPASRYATRKSRFA